MSLHIHASRLAMQLALLAALALLIAFPAYAADRIATDAKASPAAPAEARAKPPAQDAGGSDAAGKIDPDKLFGAIVKVSTRSVPDARSADSLGPRARVPVLSSARTAWCSRSAICSSRPTRSKSPIRRGGYRRPRSSRTIR